MILIFYAILYNSRNAQEGQDGHYLPTDTPDGAYNPVCDFRAHELGDRSKGIRPCVFKLLRRRQLLTG